MLFDLSGLQSLAFVDPGEIAIFIPIIALCIPIVAIVLAHRQKLAELRLRLGSQGSETVVRELQELKQQMADLRDTSTRYDMSFDAALQRIESRVGTLERRVGDIEQRSATPAENRAATN